MVVRSAVSRLRALHLEICISLTQMLLKRMIGGTTALVTFFVGPCDRVTSPELRASSDLKMDVNPH